MAIIKTATNKQTGEKVGYDDVKKKWVPIPPVIPGGPAPPSGGPPQAKGPEFQKNTENIKQTVGAPFPDTVYGARAQEDFSGPPTFGRKLLQGAVKYGAPVLEAASLPFKPLTWAVDKLVTEPLRKVPGMNQPIPFPEAGAEAMAAAHTGDFSGMEQAKGSVPLPPAADIIGTGLDIGLTAPYAKLGGKLLKSGLGLLKHGPKGTEVPTQWMGDERLLDIPPGVRGARLEEGKLSGGLDRLADTDLQGSAEALLAELGMGPKPPVAEEWVKPAAAPVASPVPAPKTPAFATPEPGMGPLFGGARETVARPPLAIVPPKPSPPSHQPGLFPAPMLSPVRYGGAMGATKRGPLDPGSANAFSKQLKEKKAMDEIQRIRALMGGK